GVNTTTMTVVYKNGNTIIDTPTAYTAANNATVTVTAYYTASAATCTDVATITLHVNPRPSLSISASKDCSFGPTGLPSGKIRVTGSSYVTLQLWSAGANGAIGGGDDVQIGNDVATTASPYDFNNLATGSYYVVALNPNTGGTGSCNTTSNVAIVAPCYWFNIVKLTQGIIDPTRNWTFTLYQVSTSGSKTAIATATTSGDTDGVLDFGFISLDPTKKYTICEEQMAVAWSAIWTINGSPVVTYNPDAPQDLGNRCFDFGAGTSYPSSLIADGVFTININNTYPGGTARTPGYWKNWNRCT
ncbi:MAG TPA: hypothetical protein VGK10_21005, partial [Prolixibacteraceae bacterium]